MAAVLLFGAFGVIFYGSVSARAESASPIALLSPTEVVGVRPGQPVYVQVSAPGWSGVEITENGEPIGASTGSGPNYSVSVTLTGSGTHALEAVGISGSSRSVPLKLPPVLVTASAPGVADMVPIARQLPTNSFDYNGDGLTGTAADRTNDLKAALGLVRPAWPAAYPLLVEGYVLQPGPGFGSTRIDYAPPGGNRLFYKLAHSPQAAPAVGSLPPGSEYAPGSMIEQASYYDYITLTETDAAGKVVRFSNVKLQDAYLMSAVNGMVRDSTNTPVAGATIEFAAGTEANGGPVAGSAVTNAEGQFTANLPPGPYIATLVAADFERRTYPVTVGRNDAAYMEVLAVAKIDAGQIRIVLTWGDAPSDLDSYLLGPNGSDGVFHVYYGQQEALDGNGDKIAMLNRDDTNSHGEETITIMTVNASVYGTYKYFVNQYSSDGSLMGSGAQVRIYEGVPGPDDTVEDRLIGEYTVPAGPGSQRNWEVWNMKVTESGVQYNMVDRMSDTKPSLWSISGISPETPNSLIMSYGSLDSNEESVQLDDLVVTAELNGVPYNLSGVAYSPETQRLSFDPIPPAAFEQIVKVTVAAAPSSNRLIPGEAAVKYTIPLPEPTAATLTGLTNFRQVDNSGLFEADLSLLGAAPNLTAQDISVMGSVYNTVTGVTYGGVPLANVALTPDGGGWKLSFELNPQPGQDLFNGALLRFDIAATGQSARLNGTAAATLYMILPPVQTEQFVFASFEPGPFFGLSPRQAPS